MLDGRCTLGILATLPMTFPSLVSRWPSMCSSCSPTDPTSWPDATTASCRHRPGVWPTCRRQHAFIKTCVGWGGMPLHMVEEDIATLAGGRSPSSESEVPMRPHRIPCAGSRKAPVHRSTVTSPLSSEESQMKICPIGRAGIVAGPLEYERLCTGRRRQATPRSVRPHECRAAERGGHMPAQPRRDACAGLKK